jgi:DNA-binding MarR family transcriptional regulator
MMEKLSDNSLFSEFGIGFSQFKILMALGHHGCVQQKQIAQFLGQTEASISRQVKLLKEAGFLTITEDPLDRKKHITELTRRGTAALEQAFAHLDTLYTPIMSKIPHSERARVLKSLSPVLDEMERTCDP